MKHLQVVREIDPRLYGDRSQADGVLLNRLQEEEQEEPRVGGVCPEQPACWPEPIPRERSAWCVSSRQPPEPRSTEEIELN